MSPPSIHLAGVRRTFAAADGAPLIALDGLDLEVAPREIVAIIGPNGSGKSTLLRIVGGLLAADAGSVEIDGRAVTGPDRAVGFVFQEPRLLPWRDALANVAYPLELTGDPRTEREARAAQLLRLVGLEGFEATRPGRMSGGMRQRVAIARALADGPSVLLLDEPFSALDALSRERFDIGFLGLWEQTATTVIVVTHSIPEALVLADRVVVLTARPGRVATIVPSPLKRPRQLADLDRPELAQAAATIRAALGGAGDPGSASAFGAPDLVRTVGGRP
ncbi:MAG TPA: ABC transporter ATP-binding protein [Patescibacteria group bacterium]|nr:ABC transporter ATP-binding protein [Patescibacteria group bacterium]